MTAAGPFLRPSQPRRRRRRSVVARAARAVARFLPMLVLPAAAWFWVSDGDTFALEAVETAGTPRISPDWIEHALAPELGSNLLALPLDRVRRRLEENPWLGRIEARKELPHVLRVTVEERVATAVLETDDGLYYMDADGEAGSRRGCKTGRAHSRRGGRRRRRRRRGAAYRWRTHAVDQIVGLGSTTEGDLRDG